MNFSRFFIDRPIFAGVLSIADLPRRPDLRCRRCRSRNIRKSCRRRSWCARNYPGANPKVIAETVATPLEEQINGVEDMLYMSSQATTDGAADADRDVPARHRSRQGAGAGAEPRGAGRAAAARAKCARLGVTTIKSSPDLTMVVHLLSPNGRYDMTYLRNYAVLNVKDGWRASPASARCSCSAPATTRCASGSIRRRSPRAA